MNGRNERPLLAVLDQDETYVWKLTEYMNTKSGFPFEAAAFTSLEKLAAYQKRQEIQVLLMDEDLETGHEEMISGLSSMIILLSDREGSSRENARYRTLNRYTPAEELITRLMDACADLRPDESREEPRTFEHTPEENGRYLYDREKMPAPGLAREKRPVYGPRQPGAFPAECELIGIYSPVGRCGKTGFALALGEILAEKKRVIYLNLERYSGLKDIGVVSEEAGDINDLIYFCRMDPESLVYRLGVMIRTFKNLDYIAPAVSGEDVMNIDAEEWGGVLATLARAGEYEAVILDLGICVTDALPLLERCTRIYMPVLDDRVSEAKISHFYRAAEHMGNAGLTEKITQLHLPALREELWGKDMTSRLVRGKMGAFARRLLQNEV